MATDYEKKYKEALERAKKMMESKREVVVEKQALETIFPELTESEDERMLREIKRYIKEQGDKPTGLPNGTVAVADMITWLEKQKECVSNNFDDVWNEEDCEDIIAEGQKLTPRFKELLKEICHAWYDRGAELEKQQEQKPAEWSEKDEKMIKRVIERIEAEIQYGDALTMAYGNQEIDWLKSLRPQPIQLKEAYKEGFQTARHATALAFMKYCDKIKPNGKMCLSNGECEEIEKAFLVGDWEKIERYFHKCQWKPSEVQMSWLLRAEGRLRIEGADILASKLAELYEDLKKL